MVCGDRFLEMPFEHYLTLSIVNLVYFLIKYTIMNRKTPHWDEPKEKFRFGTAFSAVVQYLYARITEITSIL